MVKWMSAYNTSKHDIIKLVPEMKAFAWLNSFSLHGRGIVRILAVCSSDRFSWSLYNPSSICTFLQLFYFPKHTIGNDVKNKFLV